MDKLLSLCMIARDEEKVIRRCLESVQGLVDEIVIVDTGSLDRTKEIAREFTDKVYDFTWINDFSAAKNEAIRKASSKWILILDADEYVQPDDHAILREMLSNYDPNKNHAFILPILNILDNSSKHWLESSAARIINNHSDVYFYRPIHEQVICTQGEIPTSYYSFKIFHTGYTKEISESKNKTERNLAIFKTMGEKQQLKEYDYFTLGNEYVSIDPKKALYYYKRAITKHSYNQSFIIQCKNKMISVMVSLNYIKEAFQEIDECIGRWPQYVDFHYMKANLYDQLGFYDEAVAIYLQCIQLAEQHSRQNQNFWLVSPNFGSTYPINNLLNLYFKLHDIPKTVSTLTKLLELDPSNLTHLYKLVNLLLQSDKVEDIISFLERIYPEKKEANRLRLLQTSLLLGNRELSEYYYHAYEIIAPEIAQEYTLKYAIITNNKNLFKTTINKYSKNNNSLSKLICLACFIWNDSTLISNLVEGENYKFTQLLDQIHYPEKKSTPSAYEPDISVLIQILADLFKTGYYETYDWLIQQFPNQFNILANYLGDYFYSQHQLQLAIDYYSILLSKNALGADGYENIAQLYLNQGDIDDGLDFLKKAIDLNPKKASLYINYLRHCKESDDREEYSRQFKKLFPQYIGIPIIKSLLKN